jgi:hypothetical protein
MAQESEQHESVAEQHAPHTFWSVSIVALREAPDGALIIANLPGVFRGPHIEWVEAQAELYAKQRFPPEQGWRKHNVGVIPIERGVRDDLLQFD